MQKDQNNNNSTSSPEIDPTSGGTARHANGKQERNKPSVIPTTKFINETFDFNRKKRTRSK